MLPRHQAGFRPDDPRVEGLHLHTEVEITRDHLITELALVRIASDVVAAAGNVRSAGDLGHRAGQGRASQAPRIELARGEDHLSRDQRVRLASQVAHAADGQGVAGLRGQG